MNFKDIRFGPAGLGGVKEAEDRLEDYSKKGLKACEIAFTYGAYIKNKEDAIRIAKKARELDIKLSIHAHYWINLNSKEKKKIEESKQRILDCCKIGDWLEAYLVVFHPGYYGGMDKEETYQNIKKAVLEIKYEIKKNNWKIEIAPETTGKINVFGGIDEISRLKNEANCGFVLDFAHIEARDKKVNWNRIKELFPEEKWHCHFSGIEYTEKGERKHKKTGKENWKKMLKELPKDKEIVIINESPDCVEDSVEGLKLSYNKN